jgi:hypothetical protein
MRLVGKPLRIAVVPATSVGLASPANPRTAPVRKVARKLGLASARRRNCCPPRVNGAMSLRPAVRATT